MVPPSLRRGLLGRTFIPPTISSQYSTQKGERGERREGDKTDDDDDAVSGDFSTGPPHSSAGRDFNLHIDSFAGIGRDRIVLIPREPLIISIYHKGMYCSGLGLD